MRRRWWGNWRQHVLSGAEHPMEEDAVREGVSGAEAAPIGKYELVAVLTHKGRTADSGHYIAWVKQENGA